MSAEDSSPGVDIAIVGGGLVGASLALALRPLGFRIALIEAQSPTGALSHPSFDERTTALANGSMRSFEALGVWEDMRRESAPIRRIHVSEQGRFGMARIDAAGQGLQALGYVVRNRVIGTALWKGLSRTDGVELLAPASVLGTSLAGSRRSLRLEVDGAERQLDARLVVAADGSRSVIREQAGIDADHWDYRQTAVTTTVTTQKFHEHTAFERFTPEGPIAVLPLPDGRCGFVWTRQPAEAERLLGLGDDAFLAELQDAFGFRLGRLLAVSPRAAYPLALTRSARHTAERLAVVGNAAQGLHPIAGQGFNLGLRDAACLAEILAEESASGPGFDPGDPRVLDAYARWRGEDQRRIVAFTDGLVRLFASPLGALRGLRSLGLLAFDAAPPAKRAMARLSIGAAGRVPRLARGLPLQAGSPGRRT